jgi:hypothetical protein
MARTTSNNVPASAAIEAAPKNFCPAIVVEDLVPGTLWSRFASRSRVRAVREVEAGGEDEKNLR